MNNGLVMSDASLIKGKFELFIYKNGVLVESFIDENMILKRSKQITAQVFAGAYQGEFINRISFGTSGVAATPDDTFITAPHTKNLGTPTYPAIGQVRFPFSLNSGEANGKVIREFGLMLNDNTYAARKVRAGAIEKGPDLSLSGSWTLIF